MKTDTSTASTITRYIDVPIADQRLAVGMTDIESSQISALGYDEPSRTLVIQFTPNPRKDQVEGDVYRYANVEPEVYAEFAARTARAGSSRTASATPPTSTRS
jgi:hypothetical protein